MKDKNKYTKEEYKYLIKCTKENIKEDMAQFNKVMKFHMFSLESHYKDLINLNNK